MGNHADKLSLDFSYEGCPEAEPSSFTCFVHKYIN